MANQLKVQQLLHGGDYNPDQWLKYPQVLADDIRYMKEAHVNCVSLGIFAWSKLEPEEGRFDFDWLEHIMDNLYENGIYTLLATPTGAMPHWMTEKYPEVMKMFPDGVRRTPGNRHNFCPSSPIMREKMHAMDSALAKRLGNHPGVIAWHLSNEYGGDGQGMDCFCPYCQQNFRKWLENRYQTLDNLNDAWWTGFWSNTYTNWDQIHAPSVNGELSMHGVKLDWKRFFSDQMLDFCKDEVDTIRAYSDAPVLSNFMGAFKPLNYFKWAKELDLVSLDNYPFWHYEASDVNMGAISAFRHVLTRSLKKQPYLLMESVPSAVNWSPRNTLKRPGMHELSSLQAIASGSDSVQYFQWRKSRGSSEKYHGAVIDHKNGDNTRVFRDVQRLGERLEAISDKVIGTCNCPKVALVFDWENWWALDDVQALTQPFDYMHGWEPYFNAFWQLGIDVDLVDMDDELTGYQLVVAPLNYMYRGNYIANVKRFVENGGTYITTYFSGEVNESDLCFLEEHPLRELLGIRTEEIDVRPAQGENWTVYHDKEYAVKDLCAIVHVETAEVLATYKEDFYAGYPALTRHDYGKGQAYFIAAENETAFIRDLYQKVTEELGLGCTLQAALPEGVSVNERCGANNSKLWFVMNFNASPVSITWNHTYRNIETKTLVEGRTELAGYQCLVIEEVL